ncbi:MAG TPA: HD domain-containing phosphohydrolase [Myxococcota bacterium]|jgi:HD-GYP domain-containing protein (c-di-GMP phosphodiesterase class II)/HAMP domain-containing protein
MSVGGWIQGRFLRSRVARRIFFVVVASALLPISLFAAITWFSTSAQLESDAHARLAREAKQLGMRAIERLLLIDTALAAPNVAAGDVFLSGKLRRLSVAPGAALALAPVELARLSDGAALLRLSSGAPPRVELIRQRQDESFLVADIDPAFVFAAETLRANAEIRVESGAGVLLEQRLESSGPRVAQSWEIFLRAAFGADSWRVTVAEPRASVLAALDNFRLSYALVACAGLLFVALSSSILVRRSLGPIEILHDATRRLAERDYAVRANLVGGDEFAALGASFDAMATRIERHVGVIERLNGVGAALSSEREMDHLLRSIVEGARFVTRAPVGALYLLDDADRLERKILSGASEANEITLRSLAERALVACEAQHDRALEALSLPMRNHEGSLIGVLQLSGAAFPAEDRAIAESLASQTATALTKERLASEFRALFEGLIGLIVRAIDEKSPYTGQHCRRVPILTELIADAACATREGALRDFTLSDAERYELRIAALLHDCGKVTTPVHVQDKATKLEAIVDRIELVDARFEILRRDVMLESGAGRTEPALDARGVDERLRALEADREFLRHANIGGELMAPAAQQRVREIAARWSIRSAAGGALPLLSDEEVENLTISRGTLNARERELINHHVVASIQMLEQLPYPRALRGVPAIAGAHHERMDGRGYPQGLVRDQISMQGRILGLADVFEALTAKDRPYKPGMPLRRVLGILDEMCKEGHVDPDLLAVFLRERVHLRYALEYLDPEQIDDELYDEAIALGLVPGAAARA